MNALWLLMAQTPYEIRLKGLQGAFKDRKQDPADVKLFFVIMLIFAAVVVVMMALSAIRERRRRHNAPTNPMKLFNTMLKRLKFGWKDRWLLCAFARGTHAPQPTVLLLNPRQFEKCAEAHLERIGLKALRRQSQKAIDLLRARAFMEVDLPSPADPVDYSPANSA